MYPQPGAYCLRDAVVEGLVAQATRWQIAPNFLGKRGQAVFATRSFSSTVDETQSASNQQLKHSYLSESRGGPGPTWLSEGGWAAGGHGDGDGHGS